MIIARVPPKFPSLRIRSSVRCAIMSASRLPSLRTVERLSPRVIRILGGNPGKFTLQGTNTYLVGTGPDRILIDAAHGFEEWHQSLEAVLSSEGATVAICLLTHWHPDHVLGVPDLLKLCPSAKIYKHKSSIPSLIDLGARTSVNPSDDGTNGTDGIHEILDGQVFATSGAKLTAIHSPGHTDDHVAFLLEDEDRVRLRDVNLPATAVFRSDSGTVFAGDNVLGHGTSVFEDLTLYISSLMKMREALQGQGMLYPAHGEVIKDGRAKIDEYVQHRKDREEQVIGVLKRDRDDGLISEGGKNAGQGGWESTEITKVIYRGVDVGLLEAAERGIIMILSKLEHEGRARQSGNRWWITDKAKF